MSQNVSNSPKSAVVVPPHNDSTIIEPLNTNPPKFGISESAEILSPMANDSVSVSVRSRVARLSICESANQKEAIMEQLSVSARKSTGVDKEAVGANDVDVNDEKDELAEINSTIPGSKRRRRRSSAVQGSSLGNLKQDNSSTSSIAVPKKKKKASKAFQLSLQKISKPLSIKDLRDMILFAFKDTNNSPNWLQMDNRSSLQQVVVLFAPGLLPQDFLDEEGKPLESFSDNIEKIIRTHQLPDMLFGDKTVSWYKIPVCAPGSKNSLFSAYNSFVNVGLNKKEKEQKKQQLSKKRVVMDDLLMNVDDLIESDYPIHLKMPGLVEEFKKTLTEMYSRKEYEDWVDTEDFDHDAPHTFAMDCEMCMSEDGLVLTRCSVVDFEEKLIYDELVKPDVPIIDYLTKYSGITKDKLEGVTKTLKDVQNDLLKLISTEDVLIGHSLQSDLKVLKLRHTKIIDTALIFEHKAGPPFKPALRYLASEYLNVDIQQDTGLGHDSFEDAKTCMELTKLKIQNGLTFGVSINTENLFHRLSRQGVSSMILNDSVSRQSNILKTDTNEVHVRCKDDQTLTDEICEHITEHNLFVGRLRELEYARKFAVKPNNDAETVSAEEALENFGKRIAKIYESLPSSSILLVCSGTGETRDWIKIMGELNALDKNERLDAKAKRETEIQASIKTARDAICFMTVKTSTESVAEKVAP